MFTLPTTAAAFSVPSVPSGVLPSFDAFGRNVAVLDDVKSKAQRGCSELELDFIHCTDQILAILMLRYSLPYLRTRILRKEGILKSRRQGPLKGP